MFTAQVRHQQWLMVLNWASEHREVLEVAGSMVVVVRVLQAFWGSYRELKEV